MKLIYITNTRLPSEKANSIQSIQMCASFTNYFNSVELWTISKKIGASDTNEIESFYNFKRNFEIKRLWTADIQSLSNLSETLWSQLKNITFSINVCIKLFKYRKNKSVILYSRVWLVNFFIGMLQKINIFQFLFFYELHQASDFQISMARKSSGFVVINSYLKEFAENKNISNIFMAHDGVDTRLFDSLPKYKYIKKDIYNLLYYGSLYEHKGINDIVKTLELIPGNIQLKIIGGTGVHLRNTRLLIEKYDKSGRCKLIPHMTQKSLLNEIKSSDLLILPNNNNDLNKSTSPLKLFEYMCSNKPIIASNIQAITEIVDENEVFLFDPNVAKSLVNAIKSATSQDCTPRINNCLQKVEEFTWNTRARNIYKFISSLLN